MVYGTSAVQQQRRASDLLVEDPSYLQTMGLLKPTLFRFARQCELPIQIETFYYDGQKPKVFGRWPTALIGPAKKLLSEAASQRRWGHELSHRKNWVVENG